METFSELLIGLSVAVPTKLPRCSQRRRTPTPGLVDVRRLPRPAPRVARPPIAEEGLGLAAAAGAEKCRHKCSYSLLVIPKCAPSPCGRMAKTSLPRQRRRWAPLASSPLAVDHLRRIHWAQYLPFGICDRARCHVGQSAGPDLMPIDIMSAPK